MNGWVDTCKRGHAFAPENTYTSPGGNRACIVCRRARRQRENAERTARAIAAKSATPWIDLPGETWRPVVGMEAAYEVSDHGRVRSLPGQRRHAVVLSNSTDPHGYEFVRLHGSRRAVHALVCEAFVGPRNGAPLCRHLDDNRKNNRPHNLAWGTKTDNAADAARNGRLAPRRKLSAADVEAIRAATPRPLLNRDLAALHGVSAATITRVRGVNGKVRERRR